MKIQNKTVRNFHIQEGIKENRSVQQLQLQINTMFYERRLASRDKETVRAEIAPHTVAVKEIYKSQTSKRSIKK